MRRVIAATATGLILVAGSAAQAADGVYVGGSFTLGSPGSSASGTRLAAALTAADTVNSVSVNESGTGWRVFAGQRLSSNLAFEAGFVELGTVDTDVDADSTNPAAYLQQLADNTPVAPSGFTIDFVGEWRLSELGMASDFAERLHIVGRMGVFAWQSEVRYFDGTTVYARKDNGIDLHYGAGVGWRFSDRFSTRLEWEKFQARTRMDAVSLSLIYEF